MHLVVAVRPQHNYAIDLQLVPQIRSLSKMKSRFVYSKRPRDCPQKHQFASDQQSTAAPAAAQTMSVPHLPQPFPALPHVKVQELLLHFTGSQPTSPTIHPARTFSLHTVCSTETQGSKKSSQQGLSHSQDQWVLLQQNHHLLEPHRRSRRSLALWTEAQAHGRDEARGQTRLQEPASPDRACFVT